jgi:small subunit ribosomal protein S19e
MAMNDVPANELIKIMSKELKQIKGITPPAWADFVKTGAHKERPPMDIDWWYVRVAAILRSVAKLGPIGVSKLRKKYGGKKNRGVQPEKFYNGSGSIVRKSLQQLETIGFIKKTKVDTHSGRVLTEKGLKFVSECAKKVKR